MSDNHEQPKTERFNPRFDSESRQKLRDLSRHLGISQAGVLRQLVLRAWDEIVRPKKVDGGA